MEDKKGLPATNVNYGTDGSVQSARKSDMSSVQGEFQDDDFVCPACCCGMYIDLPEGKAIKLLKSIKR